MSPQHVEQTFRYFKLRNSSPNLIGRMIRDKDGDSVVWENTDNKVVPNDSKWTDLGTETDGHIRDGEWYKFGAHVVGPMPNEWDGNHVYRVDFGSNKVATFTYTLDGVHLDGFHDFEG